MATKRLLSYACLAAAIALIALLAWINYEVIAESYGSGPPYYGRTTNMDKWTNPMPGLAAIDLPGLVVAGGLGYLGLRLRRRLDRHGPSAGASS
jgi:hypothetical protein